MCAKYIIAVLLICCAACSGTPEPTPPLLPPAAMLRDPDRQAVLPFSLKILDEINDGRELHLQVQVEAKTVWDFSQVVLQAAGLKEGRVVTEEQYVLQNLLQKNQEQKVVEPVDSAAIVFLSLPSAGITDYQLELLWGREAATVLSKLPSEKKDVLRLRRVELQRRLHCAKGPCDVSYRITGELFNSGARRIEQALLGIGFAALAPDTNLDISSVIPQHEKKVTVTELALEPGQARPIKLDLDRTIPAQESKKYQPVVRVIRYEYSS